ncbi:class I SAM-dependent methyltransferase [Streptomyces sp. NBC_01498]|uniref:class I SAM-dependent methyltransferase n=1 Tax=Streptomyces sp. NBC_01498 TaxID=2975870 RepID=UPI002E7AF0FD|nr:class I SAM-dependent methyltransferase [Streptomyces sp. NBC_01498]WTL26141.1 class I SAM-dependent methyltransferase [Streptomyces sp. NBC_01498]
MAARPSPSPSPRRPEGTVTRGTTNPNRLRRMDRWIAAVHGPVLRRSADPVAVDLGYGAAPWTAVELLRRLRAAEPRTEVVGVEIEPARVAAARPYEEDGLRFVHGGFEVPVPGDVPKDDAKSGHARAGDARAGDARAGDARAGGSAPGGGGSPAGSRGRKPVLIRAANVLRQYEEREVAAVWTRLRARLAPDGLLVEGTCDEIGRRHVWVALGTEGPRTVTFAARLASLDRPSDLAERLPKALIHRNVPGEPVHAFLRDFDRAWAAAAPYAPLGARQRWVRAVTDLSADWPLAGPGAGGGRSRWRQGEVTVEWAALAPGPEA